jgi:S-adenosylmethionine hydrolase
MAIIALVTDFGTRDHYVAAMKGVILQINAKATIVDVTHEIGPQDLLHAAFTLRHTLPFFPAGTVFVTVVDPGVGTGRRILAARYSQRIVLAPDNGVLTLLHRDAELQEIRVVENRRFFAANLSRTFHGRDILAPVAAHVSQGTALEHLGPVADRIEVLKVPAVSRPPDGSLEGTILIIDRFGNLVTNISELDLSAARSPRRTHEVFLREQKIGPIRSTYAEVQTGEPLALIGSSQLLEIAINGGSAAEHFQAHRGDIVRVQ